MTTAFHVKVRTFVVLLLDTLPAPTNSSHGSFKHHRRLEARRIPPFPLITPFQLHPSPTNIRGGMPSYFCCYDPMCFCTQSGLHPVFKF